jgi:peptide deformylase
VAIQPVIEELYRIRAEEEAFGVAAPQIGIGLRVFVFRFNGRDYVAINPKLSARKWEQFTEERCLSVPHMIYRVRRPTSLKMVASSFDGKEYTIEADAVLAAALEHEFDHLQGTLISTKGKFVRLVEVRQPVKLAYGSEK